LQDFVNSTSKFNLTVVKTLNPVFCSSHDGDPLNLKRDLSGYIAGQHGFFEPNVTSHWTLPLNPPPCLFAELAD
jgi:hypothetical protein